MRKRKTIVAIYESGLKITVIVMSARLLAWAFPPYSLAALAWLGFIPLFVVLKSSGRKEAIFYIVLADIAFYLFHSHWLSSFHFMAVPVIACFYGLFFFSLPLACTWYLWCKRRDMAMIAGPSLWAICEWVKDSFGFALSNLGYTQYRIPVLIQIADMTGVYGLSFLIFFINLFLLYLGEQLFMERKDWRKPEIACPLLGVFLLMTIVTVYGFVKITIPENGEILKIGIIQTYYDTRDNWLEHKEEHLQAIDSMIRTTALQHPDLIVLPEGAINAPVSFSTRLVSEENRQLFDRLAGMARSARTALVSGAMQTDYLVRQSGREEYVSIKEYNSALFLDAQGRLLSVYRKRFLTPFGEYYPFAQWLPMFRKLLIENTTASFFDRGETSELLTLKTGTGTDVNWGILICFESTLSGPACEYVLAGAQVLINITNDYWAYTVAGLYQALAVAVFRAVENRVPLVRAGNAGISCSVDAKGRFVDSLPALVKGTISSSVHAALPGHKTFYTVWGNAFILFFTLIFLLCLLNIFMLHNHQLIRLTWMENDKGI